MGNLDIHNYNKKIESTVSRLESSDISSKNKKLIKKFDDASVLEGIGIPRRIRVLGFLVRLAENYLSKDFDKVTKEDLKKAVAKLEKKSYSVWTKHTYKAIIKKFYKWLKFGDESLERKDYPPICSWIRTHVKRKNRPSVKSSDKLIEDGSRS
ncbi:MAG: hypothetical protein R6U61_09510 [Thermoplasmata archaeon]